VLGSVWDEFGVFGLDLGKVLAGIQAPEQDSAQFDEFLQELGYPYVEETHNEVYRRYLRK
jgi:threonine dehydratase